MTMLQRCLQHLQQHNASFVHSIQQPAVVPVHAIAKVVVYAHSDGYGLLVLPADFFVDFAEVRRLLGLAEIRLATEAEFLELFPDCELGAMPPFGNLFDMPILVDETLAIMEFFAFTAGTHRDVIRMSFDDFASLVNPLVAGFALKAVN